jgi:zinc/manganese transport system permease protein
MTELLLWPLVAGIVLTAIHAWFGLHVLARGVVFADLSLAQLAALGLMVAIFAGHTMESGVAYAYALSFALAGAVLFALTRAFEKRIQQEAIIGIVYAVSASLGVLALDRAPQGAEHVKQLLIGSILTVTPTEIAKTAGVYAVIGLLHFVLRRGLIEASFAPRQRHVLGWDLFFYASFALVVTSSVRIAGVLLVFTYLIVPAALAGLFALGLRSRLLIACTLGIALSALGLYASWHWDLPSGPAIVSAFGAATALVGIAFAVRRVTLRIFGKLASGVIAAVALILLAFPRMDQPWLDALERLAPPLQTAFLTAYERETRADMLESIAKARSELERLRALEEDVRWGRTEMTAEKTERLRQYIAGRSEISTGEALVLRSLRDKARERQRLILALPLLVLAGGGLWFLSRRR